VKQKFFRGQRVFISNKLPTSMSHFGGRGEEAIVMYSYSDVYGHHDFNDLSLLILPKNRKSYVSSWYPDHLLTLLSDNRRAGERLLQKYGERS